VYYIKESILKILALLFLLTSCGKSDFFNLVGYRRFKVGDCLYIGLRKQEMARPTYRVILVGKEGYSAQWIEYPKIEPKFISYGHLWEDYYQVVDCNKR
jgi:hypothetical protein